MVVTSVDKSLLPIVFISGGTRPGHLTLQWVWRDKTPSDRVLSAKGKPRDLSVTQGTASDNLKQGTGGSKGSLFPQTLSLSSLTDAAGHSSDESCTLPTAILWLQEGHITSRSQVLYSLMHHLGEAGEVGRRTQKEDLSHDWLVSSKMRL